MFKKLVLLLLSSAGYSQTAAADQLQYNGVAAFQSAIKNKDLKLTVLANICKICKCDLVITNGAGVTISVIKYIEDQQRGSDQ